MSLPNEILLRISNLCDSKTKLNLYKVFNLNICCNQDYYDEFGYYVEENNYHECNECNIFVCMECYEKTNIYFDSCNKCNSSICSNCNDKKYNEKYLTTLFMKRCVNNNCYYCNYGKCFNNKIEQLCEKCINSSDFEILSDR